MPTVLEEFLVSVRYAKDAASEQNLLKSLEQITGKVGLVATAIVGLGVAIFKMVEHFAEVGDAAYFMSQRLGSTVESIDATAYAMTAFGASTEEAKAAMEGLGAFSRNYGPVATQFMAGLGITATDTEGRLRQLGAFLRSKGFEPGKENSMGYAMGLRWGHMLAPGASEAALRAISDPEFEKQREDARRIQREAFGIREGPGAEEELTRRGEAIDKQAHKMALTLADFGFMFSGVMKVFSGNLFTNLQPQFEMLFKTLEHYLPTINKLLAGLAVVIGLVMGGFNDLLWGLDKLAEGFNWVVQSIDPTIKGIDGLGLALIGLGIAAMANPIGVIIASIIALLGLLADFHAYQKGGKHVFNWEGLVEGLNAVVAQIEATFKPIKDFASEVWLTLTGWEVAFDAFIKKHTGFSPNDALMKLLKAMNDYIAAETGFDIEKSGVLALIRQMTGVDLTKVSTWVDLLKNGVLAITPLGLIKDAFGAFRELFGIFEKIAALFKGDDGLTALIERFMGAMASGVMDKLKSAWEAIGGVFAGIAAAIDKALGGGAGGDQTGGGVGAEGTADISGIYGAIAGPESGFKDVENTKDPPTSSGRAQGYFQITTGTWREFASKANVDLKLYPQALGSPPDIQARVASFIPLGRWAPATLAAVRRRYPWATNEMTISEIAARANEPLLPTINLHPPTAPATTAPPRPRLPVPPIPPMPIGFNDNHPMFGGGSPMMPGHLSGGGTTSVAFNNDTDIHVYGSTDPVATAHAVGGHQDRVAANMARLGRVFVA